MESTKKALTPEQLAALPPSSTLQKDNTLVVHTKDGDRASWWSETNKGWVSWKDDTKTEVLRWRPEKPSTPSTPAKPPQTLPSTSTSFGLPRSPSGSRMSNLSAQELADFAALVAAALKSQGATTKSPGVKDLGIALPTPFAGGKDYLRFR